MSTLAMLILLCAAGSVHVTHESPVKLRILEYTDGHLDDKCALEDIAESLYISPSHLERLSHGFFGMGIIALRNRKRYERACTMLVGTSETVRSIGEALGFSEPSNFSAFFKRYSMMSPAEYRRKFTQ